MEIMHTILNVFLLAVFKEYVCPEAPIDENGLVSDIIYKYR